MCALEFYAGKTQTIKEKKKKTIENRGGRERCASELCFFFFGRVVGNVNVAVGLHRLAHLLMISKLRRLFRSIRLDVVLLLLLLVVVVVIVVLLLLPITVKVENGLE